MMYTWRQLQSGRPRVERKRGGRLPASEPIELCEQRFGFLPLRFRHRGQIQLIRRIIRSWEAHERRGGRAFRYFQVDCSNDRRVTIRQDLQSGVWQALTAPPSE